MIRRVSVVYEEKETGNSAGAFFGIGKRDIYKISADVELIKRGTSGKDQTMSFHAYRIVDIPEFSSVIDRERAQRSALDKLIKDIDTAVITALDQTLRL